MRVGRQKNNELTLNLDQNNGQGRKPVKILGEELQSVHHFTYISSSVEETGGMAT